MQFYELNSSRMDYRELSADDLDLLTPLLRSEETMQTLGGALSYEQTLDWLVDTLRRYQTEGCGWLLALDKPTGVPAALCAGLHTAVACRMQPTEKVSHTAFGKTALCVRCVVRNPHLTEKAEVENEPSEDEKSTET